jgi:hypothetical protein
MLMRTSAVGSSLASTAQVARRLERVQRAHYMLGR